MLGINWNELLDSVVLAVGRWLITGGIRVIVYIVAGITVIKTVQKIGKSIRLGADFTNSICSG